MVIVAAAIVVAVATGSKDSGSHRAQGSSTTTTTTTTVAPPIAPLTGLSDSSKESITRPALTVKIENTPEARPQSGLDGADVVYEEVVEGGITRFAAIFNSKVPDSIGPIRSTRAMDPNIVWPVGGIFAYSGGADVNVTAIKAAPVAAIDETAAGGAMFRNSRPAPHNLYGKTAQLFALGGKPVPPSPLFQYLERERDRGR